MKVHGVADADIALPDTVAKPIGGIGGNISPPAGADDQNDTSFPKLGIT